MPDRITDFRHLPLSNGFMFGQVMRDERLSKLFLEELLQKPIAKVEHIDKEKDLADTLGAHGIRLDIYIEDEQHTRYNIEMQCVNERNLERRVRYYQGGIDRNSLERGGDYVDLPETYIIFICDFDYCGAGLPIYERVSSFKSTDIPYEDGSHVFILNSRYTGSPASPRKKSSASSNPDQHTSPSGAVCAVWGILISYGEASGWEPWPLSAAWPQ